MIMIVRNDRRAHNRLENLHNKQFLEENVLDRALKALRWEGSMFEGGPCAKLIWLHWPTVNRVKGSKFDRLCIGEFRCPEKVERDRCRSVSGVAQEGVVKLPDVPDEMAYIVTRAYLARDLPAASRIGWCIPEDPTST